MNKMTEGICQESRIKQQLSQGYFLHKLGVLWERVWFLSTTGKQHYWRKLNGKDRRKKGEGGEGGEGGGEDRRREGEGKERGREKREDERHNFLVT